MKTSIIDSFLLGKYKPSNSVTFDKCWFFLSSKYPQNLTFLKPDIRNNLNVTVLNGKQIELPTQEKCDIFEKWSYLLVSLFKTNFIVHRYKQSFIIKSSKNDHGFYIEKHPSDVENFSSEGLVDVSKDNAKDTFLRLESNKIELYAPKRALEQMACKIAILFIIYKSHIHYLQCSHFWAKAPILEYENPFENNQVKSSQYIWIEINKYYGIIDNKAELKQNFKSNQLFYSLRIIFNFIYKFYSCFSRVK